VRDRGLVDLDQAGGEQSGATMARRSLLASSQAALYTPRRSCFCSRRAMMPLKGISSYYIEGVEFVPASLFASKFLTG
jgi:hypothetical protein